MKTLTKMMIVAATCFSATLAYAETKWRYYGSIGANHVMGQKLVATFEKIKEKTNGELQIRYIGYGETPYKAVDAPSVIRDRQGEMSEWFPIYSSGAHPKFSAPDLLFLSERMLSPEEMLEANRNAWQSPAISNAVDAFLDENNAMQLARWNYETVNIFVIDPVDSMDGLKGLKIRSFSPELGAFIEGLGSVPVTVAFPEVYQALQLNTINGLVAGMSSVISSKWTELVKGGFIFNLQTPATSVIINKDAFESLSPNVQQVLKEEMARFQTEMVDETLKINADALAYFEENGIKMTTATPEEYGKMRAYAQENIWPDWAARLGNEGDVVLKEMIAAFNK